MPPVVRKVTARQVWKVGQTSDASEAMFVTEIHTSLTEKVSTKFQTMVDPDEVDIQIKYLP